MKKEEKTKQTYQKILHAAIMEFGTKNYENASLNSICQNYQISKGLIYHNFRNKDDLYLCCVRICFQELTQYLKDLDYQAATMKDSIQILLQARQQFFKEYPYYANIFFNTILQPPRHLQKEIKEIRRKFDCFYKECYEKLLSKATLREGISLDMAIEYFIIFQEMFNCYFQCKSYENEDFHSFIKDHELNIAPVLDIMLYGITDKK
ncbi:MAG: TetR/AcrR family transcriptional regulator [Candidatus Fimousia sp.]